MAITARSESVMEHKIISIFPRARITILLRKYFEVLDRKHLFCKWSIFLRPVCMDGR